MRIVFSAPLGRLGQLCRRDELGARALLGDQFDEFIDSDREWVWRSLLDEVRVARSAALAGLEDVQLEPALAQMRAVYEHRMQGSTLQLRRQCPTQDPTTRQVATIEREGIAVPTALGHELHIDVPRIIRVPPNQVY